MPVTINILYVPVYGNINSERTEMLFFEVHATRYDERKNCPRWDKYFTAEVQNAVEEISVEKVGDKGNRVASKCTRYTLIRTS